MWMDNVPKSIFTQPNWFKFNSCNKFSFTRFMALATQETSTFWNALKYKKMADTLSSIFNLHSLLNIHKWRRIRFSAIYFITYEVYHFEWKHTTSRQEMNQFGFFLQISHFVMTVNIWTDFLLQEINPEVDD